VFAVEREDVEDVLCLRAAKQLLETGGVFEALFERLLAIVGFGQDRFALQPAALLLGSQELAKTFGTEFDARHGVRVAKALFHAKVAPLPF